MVDQINFKTALENLSNIGFNPVPNLVQISIAEPKKAIWAGLRHFCGDEAQWNEEYEEVSKWLSNSAGRGLLCFGSCGRGKTLLCGKIIPVLLNYYCSKIVSCFDAQQMNNNIDSVKSQHIIYLDDIGTENMSIKFGEKRMAFPELVDESEKKGKLLIISTNLSLSEIREKYGERTLDRLKAITIPVLFKGESLRK